MVREPSKTITPAPATTERADCEVARSPTPSRGKKKKPRPLSPEEAAAAKEWKGEAWKPHRATCCWKADLRDFGIEDSSPPSPALPADNKKK